MKDVAKEKLDIKKDEKPFYSGKVALWQNIDVPSMQYLSVTGRGAPTENGAYGAALGKLFSVAYAIKFAARGEGRDFVLPPQSTCWWADDHTAFVENRREEWQWNAMLRVPDWVGEPDLLAARAAKQVSGVSLRRLHEGKCFQCLHVGPYADEWPVLENLHKNVMPAAGMTFNGPHHEIYLSDPRRVAPEKLRTILRQPVRPQ